VKKDLPTLIHAELERGRWRPETRRHGDKGTRGWREEGPAIAGASRPAKERPPPSPEPFHPREKRPRKGKWGSGARGVGNWCGGRSRAGSNQAMRNAEWRMRNGRAKGSADPHAVGDLYHLPGRRARREWDGSVRKYDGTKVRGRRQMTNRLNAEVIL